SQVTVAAPRCNRLFQGLAILDNNDFLNTGEGNDGFTGDSNSHLGVVSHNLSSGEGARTQLAVIVDIGLDQKHPILLGYHRAESLDLADINSWIAFDGYPDVLSGANCRS